MDELHTTDTELDQHAAQQEAGAAGESGKAGNLKWPCPDCLTSYRIEKPGAQMTASLCEHRIHGRTCQRRFYHGIRENNGPAVMVMWPHPEEAEADAMLTHVDDLMEAVRLMRDLWDQPSGVHASRLYTSVEDVCRIYTELEKTS